MTVLMSLSVWAVSEVKPNNQKQTQTQASKKSPEKSPEKIVHSYADAVKLAAPAVVNVYIKRIVSPDSQFFQEKYRHSPGNRRYRLGSGVIMNKQGYILTNHHLIQTSKQVLVALDDGRRARAKVIGSDPQTDLAVLKITLDNLQPITLGDSSIVEVGDVVLAIGNPFGLGQTVTQGIVSAIGRSMIGVNELENYIQTDAAINPGNSGGALITTKGKLIGINTAIYSRSGGNQGIGFAIPVNVALNIMKQIIQTGKVRRGWLGISVRMLSPAYAQSIRSKRTTGVIIAEVFKNSPAEKAGLQKNDIILSVNRQRVRQPRGLSSIIAHLEPGVTMRMQIIRKNTIKTISIKISNRPVVPRGEKRSGQRGGDRHSGPQTKKPNFQRGHPDKFYMPGR